MIKIEDAKDSSQGIWASFYKQPVVQAARAYYRASPYKHDIHALNVLHNEAMLKRLGVAPENIALYRSTL